MNCMFSRRQNKYDKKHKPVFGRKENIVGKGENAGNQHFLLFPQCFQNASYSRSFNVRIVLLRV